MRMLSIRALKQATTMSVLCLYASTISSLQGQLESRPGPEAVPKVDTSLETYQVGAHSEALDEGVHVAPLDSRDSSWIQSCLSSSVG